MKTPKDLPDSFSGDFSDFFEEYISPWLPQRVNIEKMDKLLCDYFNDKNCRYVVRRFSSYQRRGHWFTENNNNFICSDNEAALWFFAKTINWDFSPNTDLQKLIVNQSFPIGMSHSTNKNEDKKEWRNWNKESWEKNQFSARGWHHAHIFDAAEGSISTEITSDNLKIRMIRLLHPLNHIPLPSYLKNNQRIWFLNNGVAEDLSKRDEVRQYIAKRYEEIYGDLWARFKEKAKGEIKKVQQEKVPLNLIKVLKGQHQKESNSIEENIKKDNDFSRSLTIEKTRFYVDQKIYDELSKGSYDSLIINVVLGNAKRNHPVGQYIIPRDVIINFIKTKLEGENWKKNKDFKSVSIPTELREYFFKQN